jgi:hypothetical protein
VLFTDSPSLKDYLTFFDIHLLRYTSHLEIIDH